MFTRNMTIADYDPVLWQAIQDENRRQEEHIELIASENYEKLKAFWKKVRTSEEFEFKNYTDGKTYRCRFVDKFSFRLDYPIGWYGSLQFEEV